MNVLRSQSVLLRWSGLALACASYGGVATLVLFLLFQAAVIATIWPWLLLSSLMSLAFLGVGCLVWWWARQRRVAMLFFLVSCLLAFSLLCMAPVDFADTPAVDVVSSLSASLGIFFLLLLFLHFPRVLLRPWKAGGWRTRLLWGWLLALGLLGFVSAIYCVTNTHFPPPALFEVWYIGYFLATAFSILGVLIVAARLPLPRRERQQLRLLFTGLAAGFAPWICLSLLPDLVHDLWPALAIAMVDDLWTVPSLVLIPLTLGYTVLRYQFLVFDALVARVVTWVLRGVSLVLSVYLGLTGFLLIPHTLDYLIVGAVVCVGLSLGLWVLAQRITTGLLFAEVAQDRHLIVSTLETTAQTHDLSTVARAIQHLVGLTCGSQDAFLLVRDEASGLYRLVEEPSATARERLDQVLNQVLDQRYPPPPLEEFALASTARSWLLHARRPSFLSELLFQEQRGVFLAESSQMVLVGLTESGVLQGLLILDVRRDQQPYAGADFDVLHELVTRVRPILTTALHRSTKTVQIQVLEEALRQTILLSQYDLEDVIAELTTLFARFVPAQVEVWERRDGLWYRLALAGAHTDTWSTEQTRRFLTQETPHSMPLFEAQGGVGHPLPLTLLSLADDSSHLMYLLAQYTRPSLFLPERRQMLMIATQHARRMLQEARERVPSEPEHEGTFSPSLVAALHTLIETMEKEGVLDTRLNDERRMRLGEPWQAIQTLLAPWTRPALPPRSRIAVSSGMVLLVIEHPLLAEMLAGACRMRGYEVVVRQSVRESLQWLQQAPRSLAAVIVDDMVLSLDAEVFVHAVMEYITELPLIVVCASHQQKVDESLPSTKVAFLPKPFALAQLFGLFGWSSDDA